MKRFKNIFILSLLILIFSSTLLFSNCPTYPHFPNKTCYPSIHAPEKVLEYYKKAGKFPTFSPPHTLILCYDPALFDYILKNYSHQQCDGSFSDIYFLTDYPGVAFAKFGVGAPVNAFKIDLAIAWKVKRFISIGTACQLNKELALGDIILCERAIRDEGTSHHYLPYAKYATSSSSLNAKVEEAAKKLGKKYRKGTSLSTDAFFPVSKEEMAFYQQDGVDCVEMEAAAEFAVVSLHRDVEIAALFSLISDSYANLDWEKPVLDKKERLKALSTLFDIALEAAKSP